MVLDDTLLPDTLTLGWSGSTRSRQPEPLAVRAVGVTVTPCL